jgi:hypothetical protein
MEVIVHAQQALDAYIAVVESILKDPSQCTKSDLNSVAKSLRQAMRPIETLQPPSMNSSNIHSADMSSMETPLDSELRSSKQVLRLALFKVPEQP